MDDPQLLTPAQVAGVLVISRSMVYRMLAEGEIPSVHVGRCLRVPRQALLAYVDDLLNRPI